MTPAPALDLTTSLRGDSILETKQKLWSKLSQSPMLQHFAFPFMLLRSNTTAPNTYVLLVKILTLHPESLWHTTQRAVTEPRQLSFVHTSGPGLMCSIAGVYALQYSYPKGIVAARDLNGPQAQSAPNAHTHPQIAIK